MGHGIGGREHKKERKEFFWSLLQLCPPPFFAEYRKVQVKEGTLANVHPQLTVKGTGYNLLLGGLEMDISLQQHLAKLFEVSLWDIEIESLGIMNHSMVQSSNC